MSVPYFLPYDPSTVPPSFQYAHSPYSPYQPPLPPQPVYPPSTSKYVYHPFPYHPQNWSAQQLISPLPKQLSMPPPPPPSHPPPPPTDVPENQPSPVASPSLPEMGGWAIWSRRPNDPSLAPAIIISPHARPPPDVVQFAIDLPTPPASPKPEPQPALPGSLPPTEPVQRSPSPVPSTPLISLEPHLDRDRSEPSSETTPACSTASDTFTPSSPQSTNTSVSISASSSAKAKLPSLPSSPVASATTLEPIVQTGTSPAVDDQPIPPAEPSPPPPPPPPSQPKPTFASLLRPTTPSAPKKPNSLPTSSVVGFSVTASDAPPSTISVGKRTELLALLTAARPAESASRPHTQRSSTAPLTFRSRGLLNSGNMCFANAVLQTMVYCVPFHRFFSELDRILPGGACTDTDTPLVKATVEFLREFAVDDVHKIREGVADKERVQGKGKDGEANKRGRRDDDEDKTVDAFVPTSIYDALKKKKRFDNMRGGHQEDAEEFFGFYLDSLEEELLSIFNALSPPRSAKGAHSRALVEEREEEAPPQENGWFEVGKRNRTVVTRTIKNAESPISRIFGGKFRTTLRAHGQKDSVIVEDWRALRLDIQRDRIHTIQDAMACISQPQSVLVTSTTKPGVTVEASQQGLIEALPPILVLHLKRFHYDTSVGDVVKIGRQVRFGPELEIGQELMSPTARKSHSARYKLFGVLYHHGLSASGGHYTLDVLHAERFAGAGTVREGWLRIDDEFVSDVRAEDVFGGVERDDRCAYLLFYTRTG